jgi:hypothetical protein
MSLESYLLVPGVVEGAGVTEQMKAEPMVLGSGDLAFYLNDTMYTEEDVHIVNPPMMKFDLSGDDDPEESDLPLYRKENDLGKMDFNWDKSLGNMEDVDKLFRLDFFQSFLSELLVSISFF